MTENENQVSAKVRNRQVYMANERTFLAWVRTGIGIMAFGFVVEKFAFFLKQMSVILGQSTNGIELPPAQGYPALIGMFLVGLGMLLVLLAYLKYKRVERQIDSDSFQSSSILDTILIGSILTAGIFLIAYLFQNI